MAEANPPLYFPCPSPLFLPPSPLPFSLSLPPFPSLPVLMRLGFAALILRPFPFSYLFPFLSPPFPFISFFYPPPSFSSHPSPLFLPLSFLSHFLGDPTPTPKQLVGLGSAVSSPSENHLLHTSAKKSSPGGNNFVDFCKNKMGKKLLIRPVKTQHSSVFHQHSSAWTTKTPFPRHWGSLYASHATLCTSSACTAMQQTTHYPVPAVYADGYPAISGFGWISKISIRYVPIIKREKKNKINIQKNTSHNRLYV